MALDDMVKHSAKMMVRIPFHLTETEVQEEPSSYETWQEAFKSMLFNFDEEEVVNVLFSAVCLMEKRDIPLHRALGIGIIWMRG